MGTEPIEAAQLKSTDWVQAPADPGRRFDPALPAWRNPMLEPLLVRQGAERPNLVPALTLPEPAVAVNAAIVLARWGDGRGHEVLADAVENVNLKLNLRQAAAEALGNLTKPPPGPALARLLDRCGRFDASTALSYVPDLHADLIRAYSRHVDASQDPRFDEALRAPTPPPRLEALHAWGRSTHAELPQGVVDLRADPSAQIRAAAIAMLLARRHPQAIEFADNALKDFDADVKAAAVSGLGRHGGPEAVAVLDRVMLHEGENLRSEAVLALHQCGALDQVWAAADDKAWRVRRSVAQCLPHHPDRIGASLACKYLDDPSAEVRRAAVSACEAWPLPVAGPVLLTALGEPTYEPRKLAAEQLARRWPPAAEFSVDLPDDRRAEAVAALETRWTAEFGLIDRQALTATAAPAGSSQAMSLPAARLDELERRLLELSRTPNPTPYQLESFGPELIDALERLIVERRARLPEFVYRQVLPSKGPAFAALELLAAEDVNERRRGADRLEALASETPLRPLVTARVAEIGVLETDGLVCRGIFEALKGDATEAAASLALASLGHPSPEVRRMACAHLGAHPRPQDAAALQTALGDPHVGVVLEAVKGLGAPEMLLDPAPVERLLTSRDVNLRLEAARTLYANRLPSGAAALERMTYEADAELRRRAAAAAAETGDKQFLPALVRLLDDPMLNVRKTAVDGLTALVGSDVSIVPGEPLPSLDERAARWRAWHARQPK